jgi:hypothetical protein
VKRVLHRCIPCNRLQSRPFNELAAPIPIERVRKARPFDQCGVDFAGPIYYKPYKYDDLGEPATPTLADQGAPPPPGEGPPPEVEQPATTTSEVADTPTETIQSVQPPIQYEEKTGMQKAYICLFTCAFTRAMHLEPVRDLSAPTFILALRRFFNATGGCTKMFSDNAQTFRCVSRYLKVLRADTKICTYWLIER